MLWFTTSPISIDHALSIWLVRSFVDPDARFEVVLRTNASLPMQSNVLGPMSRPGSIVRRYKLARQPGLRQFLASAAKMPMTELIGAGWQAVDLDSLVAALDARFRAAGASPEHGRLLAALPVGVVVIAAGVIEYINQRAAVLLGRPAEHLLSRGISEFGFQFTDHNGERLGSPEKLFAIAASRAEGMDGLLCEVEGARKFLGSIQRIEGDRLLLCLTDATRLITVERALRQSEERYRSLMDALPYGVEEFGPDGIITFANKALHKMMEYDEGELVGKPVWYFKKHENIRHELEPLLRQWIVNPVEPMAFFARNLTKSGREIDTRGDWSYQYDEHGKLMGYVGVVTDVTEIVAREEEFKKLLDELYQLRLSHAVNKVPLQLTGNEGTPAVPR